MLYDYGYHFPIAIKLNDDYVILNIQKYSQTTSRHQTILINNIQDDRIIEVTTSEIRDIINKRPMITDIKELIMDKMENE